MSNSATGNITSRSSVARPEMGPDGTTCKAAGMSFNGAALLLMRGRVETNVIPRAGRHQESGRMSIR